MAFSVDSKGIGNCLILARVRRYREEFFSVTSSQIVPYVCTIQPCTSTKGDAKTKISVQNVMFQWYSYRGSADKRQMQVPHGRLGDQDYFLSLWEVYSEVWRQQGQSCSWICWNVLSGSCIICPTGEGGRENDRVDKGAWFYWLIFLRQYEV